MNVYIDTKNQCTSMFHICTPRDVLLSVCVCTSAFSEHLIPTRACARALALHIGRSIDAHTRTRSPVCRSENMRSFRVRFGFRGRSLARWGFIVIAAPVLVFMCAEKKEASCPLDDLNIIYNVRKGIMIISIANGAGTYMFETVSR